MPAPATADEFLVMVQKSGVVEPARLDAYRAEIGTGPPSSPGELADRLVRDGLLTRFQAQNFLQGKFLGFVLGDFRILELIGSGGMSAVYLSEDRRNGRRLALKVLPRSLAKDPTILKRFYREARASAALDHPNIVRAYEVGQEQNQHFFVMEYVDGPSLQEMVQKDGALPIDRAADYITQAAIGLQHAYEQGLVHRDIKPGNLLVNRHGVVKILDMGLSRFCNAEESVLTRDVLGTLDYLAPEQAADSHTVDIRADIYSLGGTFYYLLTGQSPLNTDTLDPLAVARKANRPKPIRDLRPEVPESLVAIIDRMMAFDPQKRFPNPASLANALRLWKEGVPVPPIEDEGPATPPPLPSRPLPPIQLPSINHQPQRSPSKLLYLIVLAGCLLLAVGVGLAVWLILMAP